MPTRPARNNWGPRSHERRAVRSLANARPLRWPYREHPVSRWCLCLSRAVFSFLFIRLAILERTFFRRTRSAHDAIPDRRDVGTRVAQSRLGCANHAAAGGLLVSADPPRI